MNLKTMASLFGIVLLVVGVLGFVPALTPDGMLLGLFKVDMLHNLVHIVTGVAALAAALMAGNTPKMFFQVFGVVYGLVTILGLSTGFGLGVGLIPVNMLDNMLHILISAASLYLGFMVKPAAA
jgi:hypothetical protein